MEPTIATRECLAVVGVSHIAFNVSDLDVSMEWYKTVVGLVETKSAPGRYGQLAPQGGGFRLGLTQTDSADDVHSHYGHLAIALASMEVLTAWVERLDALGLPHTPIKENPFTPGVFSIDVFDPDDHEIELIYDPYLDAA